MKRVLSFLLLATIALTNAAAGTLSVQSNAVADAETRERILNEAITLAHEAWPTRDTAKYQRALAMLAQVDIPGNTNSCIPFWRGVALRWLGRYDEAIEQYRRADQLSPNDATTLNDWASAESKLERREEALALYERAIKSDPYDSWPYGGAGIVLNKLGRYEEAQRYFRLAIALEPADAMPRRHLASSLSNLGRYEEALEQLRVAVQLDPMDAWAHWQIGYCLKSLGKCAESIGSFQKAVDLAPEDAAHRFWLAQALQCSDRHKEAIEQAKAGLQLDPSNPDGWAYWGYSLYGLGCYCEAVPKLREALRLGSTSDGDRQELRDAQKRCWGYRLVYALMTASVLLIAIHFGRRWHDSRQTPIRT